MVSLVMDSPSGRIELSEEGGAISALDWTAAPADSAPPTPLLAEAKRQLEDYFTGKRNAFDLPLAPRGSEFRHRVWQALRAIPYGETRTYGEIAAGIGSAPRAVGGACGANPIAIIIPCHRVVGANGWRGGFSGGTGVATKQTLLEIETKQGRMSWPEATS
jgi:methylated-DNA-[protein]-cysteine S-methyltransferase